MRNLICAILLLTLAAATAKADVAPASIFGTGMILQRQMAVPVWGAAAPGEAVTVAFAGQKITGKADANGKWKVALKAMEADATPKEMTVAGASNTVTFKDVLVGEVWLCSGQSNMGLEVRSVLNAAEEVAAANDTTIRAFTATPASSTDQGYEVNPTVAAQRYALTPQEKCLGKWQPCTGDVLKNTSALAYFFARDLRRTLNVPVGVVVSSYGATAIEAWISLEGLKAIPRYHERAEAFDLLTKAYLADKEHFAQALEAQATRFEMQNQAWFKQLDAEDPGLQKKWMDPALDVSQWGHVALPVSIADNPIGSPIASIWFRKDVAIPQDWVGKELELHLGVIDAVDETYVNGTRAGRTWFDTPSYWSVSRVYAVPASAVTSTQISVTMRLLKTAYHMAPFGPAADMKVVVKGPPDASSATPVSLAGDWRMQKAQDLDAGRQPQLSPTQKTEPGHHYGQPGVMYNGLIHPLAPYAIRGATWYQGEANAPFYIDYRSLLPGLIASWRNEWGQGDFPFGIVQLADYWGEQTLPVERAGYTNLRESQAMALSVPNTFMATAVGVGEGKDIHPKRKQEVGRRLALNALGVAYGKKDVPYSSPVYKSMAVEGDMIRLRFDFAKGLHAQGDPPVGFAIAGENRAFYFAKAKIDGETVVVSSDKVPHPVAVRYAWATNPVCNVYNSENLPVFPFHTDNWDLSQLVIPEDKITIPTGWVTK
jgi:sialate O-acetylesterase